MTNQEIELIALAHGFEHKRQPDGSMALHPHVFDFARALLTFAPPASRGTDDELVDAVTASQMDVQCLEASLQDARRELIEQYHVAERLQSEVKQRTDERDLLGYAIGISAVNAGIIKEGANLSGPQLVALCNDLVTAANGRIGKIEEMD